MLLDPTTTTKALLFTNGCRILVVKVGTKKKDILGHSDVHIAQSLSLQYNFLHTQGIQLMFSGDDEEQH